LHDPVLFRVVQQLMAKVFARLVAELRRLGAHVVFGDFGRLIVATGKQDPR
jgi:DNA polymerase epsilon subunit 1